MPLTPVLDSGDTNSSTWKKIKTHLEGRLMKKMRQNNKNLDPTKTANLRGAIGEIESLMNLDKPPPQFSSSVNNSEDESSLNET